MANLQKNRQACGFRQGPLFYKGVFEAPPLAKFHDQKWALVITYAKINHPDDVWMIESPGCFGLLLQPGDIYARCVTVENFSCNGRVQDFIPALEDSPVSS